MSDQDRKRGYFLEVKYHSIPKQIPTFTSFPPAKVQRHVEESFTEKLPTELRLYLRPPKDEQFSFIVKNFFTHEGMKPTVRCISYKEFYEAKIRSGKLRPEIDETDRKYDDLLNLKIIDKKLPDKLSIRAKFFWLCYPREFDDLNDLLEIITAKLIKHDPKNKRKAYCLCNEISIIRKHGHCHVFIELEHRIENPITVPDFFDVIEPGGNNILHPNIIAKPRSFKDLYRVSYLYQSKALRSSKDIIYSFSKVETDLWDREIRNEEFLKVYNRSYDEKIDLYNKYIINGDKNYIDDDIRLKIIAAYKSLPIRITRKHINDAPNNFVKTIIRYIDKKYRKSTRLPPVIFLNIYTGNPTLTYSDIKYVIDNIPGVLDMRRLDLSTLKKQIKAYNRKYMFPMVHTIILHSLDDITDDPSRSPYLRDFIGDIYIKKLTKIQERINSKPEELIIDPDQLKVVIIRDTFHPPEHFFIDPPSFYADSWTHICYGSFVHGFIHKPFLPLLPEYDIEDHHEPFNFLGHSPYITKLKPFIKLSEYRLTRNPPYPDRLRLCKEFPYPFPYINPENPQVSESDSE